MLGEYDSYAEFLNVLAERRLLNAFRHEGIHITVNTLKELSEAERNIERI